MGKYLDNNGVSYLWSKMKEYVRQHSGGGSSPLEIFPIGTILQFVNDTDPNTLYGGTWTKIEDAFLYGSGTKGSGDTGGSETYTLTANNLPSHRHSVPNHQHDLYGYTWYWGNHSTFRSSAGIPSGGTNVYANTTVKAESVTSGTNYLISIQSNINKTKSSGSTNTGYTGSAQAIDNMPPYRVVNIWERTA